MSRDILNLLSHLLYSNIDYAFDGRYCRRQRCINEETCYYGGLCLWVVFNFYLLNNLRLRYAICDCDYGFDGRYCWLVHQWKTRYNGSLCLWVVLIFIYYLIYWTGISIILSMVASVDLCINEKTRLSWVIMAVFICESKVILHYIKTNRPTRYIKYCFFYKAEYSWQGPISLNVT